MRQTHRWEIVLGQVKTRITSLKVRATDRRKIEPRKPGYRASRMSVTGIVLCLRHHNSICLATVR